MLVCYLNRTALTVYLMTHRHVEAGPRFANDDEGIAQFVSSIPHLKNMRSKPMVLLSALGGENIVTQLLPYATGKDRKELLKRKMQQLLNNSPYAMTFSLGREKEGRRDERLLFYGINQTEQLQKWVNAFQGNEIVFAGLVTPALATERLLAKWEPRLLQSRVLLLLVFDGGLRQYFYLNGTLRSSRLIPLGDGLSRRSVVEICEQESRQLRQFLVGQQLIPRDEELVTLVPIPPSWERDFSAGLVSSEDISFRFVHWGQIANKYGLPASNGDFPPVELISYAATDAINRPQLAPDSLRSAWNKRRLIHWATLPLGAVGIALALFALGLYGLTYFQQLQLDEAHHQVEQTDAQRKRIIQALPPLPVAVDDLRDVMMSLDSLHDKTPTLWPLLQHVARTMDKYPEVILQKIEWSPVTDNQTVNVQTTILELQLPRYLQANQRKQLEMANSFLQSLNSDGYRAVITQQPFDIDSSKPLTVSGAPSQQLDLPHFTIRLESAAP